MNPKLFDEEKYVGFQDPRSFFCIIKDTNYVITTQINSCQHFVCHVAGQAILIKQTLIDLHL